MLVSTQLTAVRIALNNPPGLEVELPRPADALAYQLSRLRCLRRLSVADEMHEPSVLEVIAALQHLTALEGLCIRSNMPAFPQLVMEVLAGRTTLRRLVLGHDDRVPPAEADSSQGRGRHDCQGRAPACCVQPPGACDSARRRRPWGSS